MRNLIILRGIPGSGKSSWVTKNSIEEYTLSSDKIRLMYSSKSIDEKANVIIPQNLNGVIFNTLYQMLESRMQNGCFTVVDATNIDSATLKRYSSLAKRYGYRVACINFPISVKEASERISKRVNSFVSNDVLYQYESKYTRTSIPKTFECYDVNNFSLADFLRVPVVDLSKYKKIIHMSDIHGCYTALNEYLRGSLSDENFYIFCGDYCDRGIENANVLKFLNSIKDNPNVVLIEGNHEKWLRNYVNGCACTNVFSQRTAPELESAGISKAVISKLLESMQSLFIYAYGEKKVVCTHGGISRLSDNPAFFPSSLYIRGSGVFADDKLVDDTFESVMPSDYFQVHGHRNSSNSPIAVNSRCFNIDGFVDKGDFLRVLELSKDGFKGVEIKNNVFFDAENDNDSLVCRMRKNPYVNEKNYGVYSSFNFSRKAFQKQIWDEQTVKARGLYVNLALDNIIARGYEKFFSINEVSQTELSSLRKNLKYPLNVFKKENGFLGIVSIKDGKLFCTTKSDPYSPHSGYFKTILSNSSLINKRLLEDYLTKTPNCSLVFEVIDTFNDPHIVKYDSNKLFLLDVIENSEEFNCKPYSDVVAAADYFGCACKVHDRTIENDEQLMAFLKECDEVKFTGELPKLEGYVVVDANNFMFKIKLAPYKALKYLRGISNSIIANKNFTLNSDDKNIVEYVTWLKKEMRFRATCGFKQENIIYLYSKFLNSKERK